MLEKYLQDIGFSDKEVKVYLSALELGEASVMQIAKKSKINRTTAYPILTALQHKGLISFIQKGKKQLFYAESPSKLKTFVETQIRALEIKKDALPELIKQLDVLENRRSNKPIVRFYDGLEGINSMLEEFIDIHEKVGNVDDDENKIHIAYSRDLQETAVPEQQREYRRQIRNTAGIKSIYLYTKEKGEVADDNLRVRIKVDGKKYPFPAHIAVFKDRIRLISHTKNMAILIVDAELAQTLRSIMELAEKGAK